MNKPQPSSSRLRLQALLAIPERQRTEAEWDELNELEIILAPGNRAGAPEPRPWRGANVPPGRSEAKARPYPQNPDSKFHRRRPKRNAP